MNNRSLTLDIFFDGDNLDEFVQDIESKFKIKATVLNEIGHCGGSPTIKFEGIVENLQSFFIYGYCHTYTLSDALNQCGFDSFEEVLD